MIRCDSRKSQERRGEEKKEEAHIVACFEEKGERTRQISHPDQMGWKGSKRRTHRWRKHLFETGKERERMKGSATTPASSIAGYRQESLSHRGRRLHSRGRG